MYPALQQYGILDTGKTIRHRLLAPIKSWLRREWMTRNRAPWKAAEWIGSYVKIPVEQVSAGAADCGPLSLILMHVMLHGQDPLEVPLHGGRAREHVAAHLVSVTNPDTLEWPWVEGNTEMDLEDVESAMVVRGALQPPVVRKQRLQKRWLEALEEEVRLSDLQDIDDDNQAAAADDATRVAAAASDVGLAEGQAGEGAGSVSGGSYATAKWHRADNDADEEYASRVRVGEWRVNELGLFARTRFHAREHIGVITGGESLVRSDWEDVTYNMRTP